MLSLPVLGAPPLEIDGRTVHLDTRKAIVLLASLGVGSAAATRDSLVTLLWSRYGRKQGHAALRRTLSARRSELRREWLITEREAIGLSDSSDVWIDLRRVRELLARARAHPRRSP